MVLDFGDVSFLNTNLEEKNVHQPGEPKSYTTNTIVLVLKRQQGNSYRKCMSLINNLLIEGIVRKAGGIIAGTGSCVSSQELRSLLKNNIDHTNHHNWLPHFYFLEGLSPHH